MNDDLILPSHSHTENLMCESEVAKVEEFVASSVGV